MNTKQKNLLKAAIITMSFVQLGTGIGIVAPLAPALVNESFVNNERQTMLGWQNAD